MTRLDKPRRRGIGIDSRPCRLVLGPYKLKLTPKGRRQGIEVPWPAMPAMTEHEQATPAVASPARPAEDAPGSSDCEKFPD